MSIGDTCTLIYGLPYPTGASAPCNVSSTGCDFAVAVEEQLDILDGFADQLANVPFAYGTNIAEIDYDNSLPGNFPLFFDTTLADTDNMIDLSLNPAVITIRTEGVYSIFGDIEISIPIAGTSAIIQTNVQNTLGSTVTGASFSLPRFPTSPSMPLRTDGTRTANVCATFEFIADCEVGYTITTILFVGGATGTISNIQTFRMGAIWLRGTL